MFPQSANAVKRTGGETPISIAGARLGSMLVALPLVPVGVGPLSVRRCLASA